MIDPAVMRRIKRIELRTRRLVNESFAGAYYAVFKGRGIAFDTVRLYEPGDDVRDIDWNVTARAGEPHIKQYVEERELTVMLVVDASASVFFGSHHAYKRDIAAELGAVLALSAITNNDKAGLMIFSDQVEQYIPPRKGRNHTLRVIRELLAVSPAERGTDLALALRTLNRLLKRRAIVFVLSDFLAPVETYRHDLLLMGKRHDVIAVTLTDALEYAWPDVGLVGLQDLETGTLQWIDTGQRGWREAFNQRRTALDSERHQLMTQAQVDEISVPADGDYVGALTMFFQKRARRIRS